MGTKFGQHIRKYRVLRHRVIDHVAQTAAFHVDNGEARVRATHIRDQLPGLFH
jgi:hypothetical protein